MKRKQVITLLVALSVAAGSLGGCGFYQATSTSPTSMYSTEPAAANDTAPAMEADVCVSDEAVSYEPDCYEEYPEEYVDVCTEDVADAYVEEEAEYCVEAPAGSVNMMAQAAGAAEEAMYDGFDYDRYDRTDDRSDRYDRYDDEKSGENGSYLDDIYGGQEKKITKGTEEYSKLEEIGFKSTWRNPRSTFAADVDTASYSNLRRMLNEGYSLRELPEGSVRIEELINYFNYDYKNPTGKEPFGVTTVLGDCPWNEDAKLLSIGLKTEDIDFSDTPASNLVFLIDVSGSMFSDDKLPLLQNAFCMLVDELSEKDRVSIVTYAGNDSIVLEGVSGDKGRKIKRAINDLEAGGTTNGSAGIKTAYSLAEKYFIKGGNNRVILATDGDLNVGLTSVDDLESLISRKKESGVFLSVLGFGTGNIKDNKMETLADKGNGNYAYIDSNREAKKVLVKELSANMLTVCKDVKLQVEFNPDAVIGYRLIGYANRVMSNKDFNDDTKDGGEIGAGHTVTALYELILDDDSDDDKLLDLNIRFKRPSADTSELLTYPVTFDSYKRNPGDDFYFQSAVAEFGLIASHSEYAEDANLDDVMRILESIDLNDEYKEEFCELVEYSGYYY